MATPKRALHARNSPYVLQKPVPSSRAMKRMLLKMKGHLRPNRSDQTPKMMAPTDRNMSTRVIPQVISELSLLNSLASGVTVKLTVKKSKASITQAHQAH